jgi:hypothetical protein
LGIQVSFSWYQFQNQLLMEAGYYLQFLPCHQQWMPLLFQSSPRRDFGLVDWTDMDLQTNPELLL